MLRLSAAEAVVMTYTEVTDEILAVQPRRDRHRQLIARSDDLLARLESLNLAHYGSVKVWSSNLDDCRLTHALVRAVNELLVEVGLDSRRLATTREAIDAVFDCQDVLFGHPADDESHQEEMFT
jgi:hypothetical protein